MFSAKLGKIFVNDKCFSEEKVKKRRPERKRLVLPTGITKIYERGIWDCPALEEIVVPDGSQLQELATSSLGAESLKHFTFEGSTVLTTIGDEVFKDKTKLESFTIPATVTTVGKSAFMGCTGLKDDDKWYDLNGRDVSAKSNNAFSSSVWGDDAE